MMTYFNILLLVNIYLCKSYVLMSDINGRLCDIDFSTYYLDFNYTSNNDIVELPLNLYHPVIHLSLILVGYGGNLIYLYLIHP